MQQDGTPDEASLWNENYSDEAPGKPVVNYMFDRINLDILQYYTEEEAVPEPMRMEMWALALRGLSNGFLKDHDMMMVDSFYHLFRVNYMERLPTHRITPAHLRDIDQAYMTMLVAAKRAIGVNGDVINERTMQNTQVMQNISQASQKMTKAPGFLGRIFG